MGIISSFMRGFREGMEESAAENEENETGLEKCGGCNGTGNYYKTEEDIDGHIISGTTINCPYCDGRGYNKVTRKRKKGPGGDDWDVKWPTGGLIYE